MIIVTGLASTQGVCTLSQLGTPRTNQPMELYGRYSPVSYHDTHLVVVTIYGVLRNAGVVNPSDQFLNPLVGKGESIVNFLNPLLPPVVHGLVRAVTRLSHRSVKCIQ